MGPVEFALGSLASLVASKLHELWKSATDRLDRTPAVKRAIEETSLHFPDLELKSLLKIWCASKSFNALISKGATPQSFDDNEALNSFVEVTRFDGEFDLAKEILRFFFAQLQKELSQTPANALEHDALEANRHAQTQMAVDSSAGIIRELQRDLTALRDDVARLPAEKAANALVDQARDKLQNGEALIARGLLEAVRAQSDADKFSDELKFRVATNLGGCALQLGEEATAARELEEALRLQLQSEQALSNGAVAAYLRDEYATAIERSRQALKLSPCEPNALSIQIQALWRHEPQLLEAFVEEAELCINKTPLAQLALASVRAEQERWREARQLSHAAAKAAPALADAHQIYSQCISIPLRAANLADPQVTLSRFTRGRLRVAERAQSRAIELLQKSPDLSAYGYALSDRAAVRLMCGDIKGCLEDCETVSHLSSLDVSLREAAKQHQGVALIRSGKLSEAVEAFRSLQDPTRQRQVAAALAYALLQLRQPNEAIEVISPHWKPERGEREQLEFASYLLEAHRVLNQRAKVEQTLSEIESVWGDDPDAASVLAAHRQREGDDAGARQLLEDASQAAPPDSRAWKRLTHQLAELLFRQQQYDAAIPLFEAVVDTATARDNTTLAHYLVALFYSQKKSGARQQALDIARGLREREGVVETVSEVEANLLYEAGRFQQAREIFRQLAQLAPSHWPYQLRSIQLAIVMDEKETARLELEALDETKLWDDAAALMQIAQFRAFLEMPMMEALGCAYRALRLGFGDADIHRSYVGLFLNVTRGTTGEGPTPLDSPARVEVNSGVRLRRVNDSREYVILAGGPHHEDRGELAPTHPIAQKLLGMRRGDYVTLGFAPHEVRYEIAEVLHPYVLAFQDSIARFAERFAQAEGMRTLNVAENDFSEMLAMLDDRHEFMESLLALYRDWKIPFCFFARHSGRSVFEVWEGLRLEPRGGIHSDRGHDAELEAAALLPTARRLALDATALITVYRLGLIEAVKQRFDAIVAPTALARRIRRAVVEIENDESVGTIGRGPNGYFHYETSPQQRAEWHDFARGARDMMEANIEITDNVAALMLERERYDELQDAMGESALESVFAAVDETDSGQPLTLLWSDDEGLRELGLDLCGVQGVSTFRVLMELWRGEVLTRGQFYESWRQLLLLGYRHLPVTPEFLAWMLERENFHVTAEVRAVFASLEPPTVEESAIEAAADTLKIVWQQKPVHPRELETLDLCLAALTKGRDTERVIEQFKSALADLSRFGLLPLELEHFMRAIRGWTRGHLQTVDRRLMLPTSANQPLAPTQRNGANGHGSNGSSPARPAELSGMNVQLNEKGFRNGEATSEKTVAVAEFAETEHHALVEATQQLAGSVVCLLSALQFHRLTTQNPFEVWLAVPPPTATSTEFYPPLRLVVYPAEALSEGVEVQVLEGETVNITNPARTAVDCFRFRNEVGLDVALEALRDCRRQRKGTIAEFGRYARLWGIEEEIRPYLESLFQVASLRINLTCYLCHACKY